MDRCTGHHNITEILVKAGVKHHTINQSVFPNDKFNTLPNCESLQTTILCLMIMGESFPKGYKMPYEQEKLFMFAKDLHCRHKEQGLAWEMVKYICCQENTKCLKCMKFFLSCKTLREKNVSTIFYWEFTEYLTPNFLLEIPTTVLENTSLSFPKEKLLNFLPNNPRFKLNFVM